MQEEEIMYTTLESEDVAVETGVTVIETPVAEVFEMEMSEAFPAISEGDVLNHALLNNRDLHDAHPISAITGLRDELDEIERIKTVYAAKTNVANYYQWYNAAYNECGYFVSIVPNTSMIRICEGCDIFGVSVSDAGFIGGQDPKISRDHSYGLVVTSGFAEVRCESDVTTRPYE